jgi:delta-1-pyrroline-5-carboxylate synthetase
VLVLDTDPIYGHFEQNLSSEERKKILLDVADALEANEDLIRSENEADVAVAHEAGYESSLVARLTLKPGKVDICIILFLLN